MSSLRRDVNDKPQIREIDTAKTESEDNLEVSEQESEIEPASFEVVSQDDIPPERLSRLMNMMAVVNGYVQGGQQEWCPNHPDNSHQHAVTPEPDPTLYEIPAIVVNLNAFAKTKHIPALDKQLKRFRNNKGNIKKVVWDRQWSLRDGKHFKKNDQNEYKIILMLLRHYNRIADELRTLDLTDLHITEFDALREVYQESGNGDMLWQNQFHILMDKTKGSYNEKLSMSYGSNVTTKRLSIACNTFSRLSYAFNDLEMLPQNPDAIGTSQMAGINFKKFEDKYPNLEILKFHFINAFKQPSYAEPFLCLSTIKLLILTFEFNEEPTGFMIYKRDDDGNLQRVNDEDEITEALDIEIP